MCQQRKLADGPMLLEEASEPAERDERLSHNSKANLIFAGATRKSSTNKREGWILYLATFLAVREVAMSGEPSGSEGFAWIRMLWTLNNNKKNTVDELLQTDALPWLL